MRSQRWVVDAIEGDVARVEVDGGAVQTVPRVLLPDGVREGSVLAVSWRRTGPDRSAIDVRLDPEAEASRREASARQVADIARASRERDRGGDVVL